MRRELADVLGFIDGQVGPVLEEAGGFGAGAALELGFDGPGEAGAVVSFEDGVYAVCVEVFGVEEEAVHVEETGPNWGEAVGEFWVSTGLSPLIEGITWGKGRGLDVLCFKSHCSNR